MLLTRRALAIAGAVVLSAPGVRAEDIVSPVPGKRVSLRGYDPVAYFTDGRPVRGVPAFWFEFDDAVYLFASAEHRALFVGDPDHYAPQFRGFCALSVSVGQRDEPLPDQWEITDGKLFVFGKPTGIQDFATDPPGITARARANWAAAGNK